MHRLIGFFRVIALSGAALLAACGGADAPSAPQTATSAQPSENVPTDGMAIISDLHAGMAYATFRERVLAHGWTPRASPSCTTDLIGDDANAVCARSPQLAACHLCEDLPELQSCSGDARCLMRFRYPGSAQDLEARAYGEIDAWRDTGDDAGLQISTWEFVPNATQ